MRATIKPFRSITEMNKYFDRIINEAKSSGTNYGQWLTNHPQEVNSIIRVGGNTAIKAYGSPLPLSYDDAKARCTFQNMPLYTRAYDEFLPLLEAIAQKSEAILPTPVMMPNERMLGSFSMDRAGMGLMPRITLYSKKHKQNYTFDKAEKFVTKEGKTALRLKTDKSPLEIVQDTNENGRNKWTTNNKKSFMYKENVEKPNAAVRLFCLIGANWGSDTYWAGLASVIIGLYLESKGYKVNITMAVGIRLTNGMMYEGKMINDGCRFYTVPLKDYADTYDSPTILYYMADSSYFRVKVFEQYMAYAHKKKDGYNENLGYMPSIQEFEESMGDAMRKKYWEKEENVLYYYIGGSEVTSLQKCVGEIERIALDVQRKNAEIIERIKNNM